MSFLRWAGSKKQLGEVLENCWYAAQCAGGSGRYIEGFCGSASLFFRLMPHRAMLVDINQDLISCFQTVRSSPRRLSSMLQTYPISEEHYYHLRSLIPQDLTEVERSARFIYLNRFCFNGLYRTNRRGHFNVPYGGGRTGELPSLDSLLMYSRALKNAELISGDFSAAIGDYVGKGDFIYLDPPYAKRNHSLDLQYGPDVFGMSDLARANSLLSEIDSKGAFFVFSYAECEEVMPIAERWGAERVIVKRTIAADSTKRNAASELLISNL